MLLLTMQQGPHGDECRGRRWRELLPTWSHKAPQQFLPVAASSLTMAITPFNPHNNPFHRRGNRLREHVPSHTYSQAREPETESRSVTPKPMSLALPPKCIRCFSGSRNRISQACALPLPCKCQLDKKGHLNVAFKGKGCLLIWRQ